MITVTELSSFFFFKQKTAYELRISDWSSDVCSSDLVSQIALDGAVKGAPPITDKGPAGRPVIPNRIGGLGEILNTAPQLLQRRSEEHTSELQSLMRISYAVFCLKKKKKTLNKSKQQLTK